MSAGTQAPHVGCRVYGPKKTEGRREFLTGMHAPNYPVEFRQPCGRFYRYTILTLPLEDTVCACHRDGCIAVEWKLA